MILNSIVFFVIVPLVVPAKSWEDVDSFELHLLAPIQHIHLLLQVSEPSPLCRAKFVCTTTMGCAAPLVEHFHPCIFHDHFQLLGVSAACSCGIRRTPTMYLRFFFKAWMLCVLWVDSIIPSKTILVTITSFCRSVVHAGLARTWWSWDIMRPSCRCLIMRSSCTTAACCCCCFSFFCNCFAWRSSTCRWRLDSWPKKKLEKKEATRWKSLSKKKIFSFNLSLMKLEVCNTVFQQLTCSKLQRWCTTAAPPVVPARSTSWCSPCAAAGLELVWINYCRHHHESLSSSHSSSSSSRMKNFRDGWWDEWMERTTTQGYYISRYIYINDVRIYFTFYFILKVKNFNLMKFFN